MFAGAGVRTRLDRSYDAVQPVAEVGIAFEARLFGLYPLRSRLWVEYQGGAQPWAVRWTLGNVY